MRKDSGVAPLRSQGATFSDASDKAKILNNQFSSVFTQEPIGSMPDKGPPMVLKTLSNEIAPILQNIFQITLTIGQVLDDWKEANVASIFENSDK